MRTDRYLFALFNCLSSPISVAGRACSSVDRRVRTQASRLKAQGSSPRPSGRTVHVHRTPASRVAHVACAAARVPARVPARVAAAQVSFEDAGGEQLSVPQRSLLSLRLLMLGGTAAAALLYALLPA